MRKVLAILVLDDLFNRESFFTQALLNPRECESESRTLALQAASELSNKRGSHKFIRARQIGHQKDKIARLPFRCFQQPVHPVIGLIPITPVYDDARHDTPQILDQRQPQHDWNRP